METYINSVLLTADAGQGKNVTAIMANLRRIDKAAEHRLFGKFLDSHDNLNNFLTWMVSTGAVYKNGSLFTLEGP